MKRPNVSSDVLEFVERLFGGLTILNFGDGLCGVYQHAKRGTEDHRRKDVTRDVG